MNENPQDSQAIPEQPKSSPLPSWRKLFKTPREMKITQKPFLVEGVIAAGGINFLGGPAGHGKSWVAISLAKALLTGQSWLNHFRVSDKTPVLYLIPESCESAFKNRLDIIGMGAYGPEEGLYCRTLSDGPLLLTDDELRKCCQDIQPVVILDTAIRFNPAADENDASQTSSGLTQQLFDLLGNKARAIIALHHGQKSLAEKTTIPTTENTLRGSGDLGASATCVWCVRSSNLSTFRSELYPVTGVRLTAEGLAGAN